MFINSCWCDDKDVVKDKVENFSILDLKELTSLMLGWTTYFLILSLEHIIRCWLGLSLKRKLRTQCGVVIVRKALVWMVLILVSLNIVGIC